jgi:hypothetical protein
MDIAHPALPAERDRLPVTRFYRMVRPVTGADLPVGSVRGREAVIALASELFRLDVRDAAESRRQFEWISALAEDVPIEWPGRQLPAQAAAAVLCKM